MSEHVRNFSQKSCGQSDYFSLRPHLKQQVLDSSPTFSKNTTPTNAASSMNNSSTARSSTIKRNLRPTTRSQKERNSSSPPRCSLLTDDEERLLDYVLDAYIVCKGAEDLMVQSLSEKLDTDVTKMKILCQTLCQLIEVKIQ